MRIGGAVCGSICNRAGNGLAVNGSVPSIIVFTGCFRFWQDSGKWLENCAGLEERAKGDREKLKLAVRLGKETSVTVKWIAQRLNMGTWTHLNHLLYWQRREAP